MSFPVVPGTHLFLNPQMVPFSSGGKDCHLCELHWGPFVPNYSNPCCPFKSLREMNGQSPSMQQMRNITKVDNKGTPAITTETRREKEATVANMHKKK